MKYLYSTLLLLMCALPVSAQRYVITGHVKNAKSGAAVEYASAALLRADSSAVTAVMTEEDGSFRLPARSAGQFIVKLSYVGFKTSYTPVTLTAANDSVSLGVVKLESNDHVLGTATVSVTAARVEQKEDTTMFNAAAYRVPEGSTLEALVDQLPGVEIDDNGTIKWNGKEVKELLVNGKDFFKGDTKVAMKNLPTDMVSKIKAYDKKSDYTEMTGIDDGEETTVLDIVTKRELNESWVSNVDLGIGTKDRYSGKIFATRFTDHSRISAYGSANNVGDRGFGGPRGFGGGTGLTATKEAGLDFSWENGKQKREAGRLELGGNVNYRHSGTDVVRTTSSETFLSGGGSSSFGESASFNRSTSTSVNARLNLQWNPDSMTQVSFRPSFTYSENDGSSVSRSGTFNSNPREIAGMYSPLDSLYAALLPQELQAIAVNRNDSRTLSEGNSKSVSGTLNITRRLGSNGRNVSLRANGGYTHSESESFSLSDIRYYQGSHPGNLVNQYSDSPSKSYNYGIRLGYVEPLGKQWFAELRYGYNYRYTDQDRSRYNLDSLGGVWAQYETALEGFGTLPTVDDWMNAARDDFNSQYATYKYYNHSVNVGLRYNTEAIRFNAGVELAPEKTKLNYQRFGQNIDTLITRDVFNVSPQIRFRYRFNKTTNLDIRYRGSSSQPSMTDLIAVVDDSNPLSVSMGNPGLKPSWTDNITINYNAYDPEKQMGMHAGVNFSRTNRSVSNRMVYDETTGVRYTRPENINGKWNAGGRFMINTGFGPKKMFTIQSFSRINYSNDVGYISRLDNGSTGIGQAAGYIDGTYDGYDRMFKAVASEKNTTRTLGLGEHMRLAYRADWFDVGLLGRVNYQHARATLQDNANMDTWNFAYGANANINMPWGMSLSTDIRMSSRRGYAAASMNTNELLWNAQLSQSFLKGKAATISFQVYDILHQQSNVSRSLTASMRSDSWNNAINAYCMVHFIYKLNIFPGGSTQSGNSKMPEERSRGGFGPASRGAMPMHPMGGAGRGGF